MKKTTLSFLLVLISIFSFGQSLDYGKKIVSELASPQMYGRGYAKEGDLRAAKLIMSEFEKYKVRSFGKSYFQYFNLNANVFSGQMEVKISGNELKPGVDYLVWASTPSLDGNFEIETLNAKIISKKKKFRKFKNQDFSNKFVLIDTAGLNKPKFKETYDKIVRKNMLKAKGLIVVQDRNLTHRPSRVQNNFAVVEIKRESLPKKSKEISAKIEAEFKEKYQTQNVIGYVEGKIDSFVVFTAHYDHLGLMGKNTVFTGANDNASGVAMVLNLAKELAQRKSKPKYSVAFMLFSGEEMGLLGSKYYTENPVFELDKIKVLFNLDMVGSGENGITLVNGKVFTKEFERLEKINNEKKYVAEVKGRPASANSDHYFFTEKGVTSFFIYTRGNFREYHNIYDVAPDVPLTEFEDLQRLLLEYIKF